eukprot:TRINITY_DN25058_c0_g1_i1.p1 TRINITY_DN25058_c0_g1~~TRINITY_DN25058_c0_g1_i1.p1  ORF type:complete len:130 (+),score=17.98 TRINITY_DN25058_c0_g1_i1:70-459(+)
MLQSLGRAAFSKWNISRGLTRRFATNQTNPKTPSAVDSEANPNLFNLPGQPVEELSATATEPAWVKQRQLGNYIIAASCVGAVAGIYYYTLQSIGNEDFAEYENERKLGVKKPMQSSTIAATPIPPEKR